MRTVVICFTLCLAGSLCFGQADSSKVINQQPVDRQVAIPGVDTPVSGPGLTAQVPLNTPPPQNGRKKRRTQPPSDPRAFGVGIPIEKDKAKKDTLRN